jgi:hypothetical protein
MKRLKEVSTLFKATRATLVQHRGPSQTTRTVSRPRRACLASERWWPTFALKDAVAHCSLERARLGSPGRSLGTLQSTSANDFFV